jgi:hypothetical protein
MFTKPLRAGSGEKQGLEATFGGGKGCFFPDVSRPDRFLNPVRSLYATLTEVYTLLT